MVTCPNLCSEDNSTAGIQTFTPPYVMLVPVPHIIALNISQHQLRNDNYPREGLLREFVIKHSSSETLQRRDKYQRYLRTYCIQSQWACTEALRHQACAVKLSVCKRQWHRGATKELIMWKEGHLIAWTQAMGGIHRDSQRGPWMEANAIISC